MHNVLLTRTQSQATELRSYDRAGANVAPLRAAAIEPQGCAERRVDDIRGQAIAIARPCLFSERNLSKVRGRANIQPRLNPLCCSELCCAVLCHWGRFIRDDDTVSAGLQNLT
jgi:hypothetical protein